MIVIRGLSFPKEGERGSGPSFCYEGIWTRLFFFPPAARRDHNSKIKLGQTLPQTAWNGRCGRQGGRRGAASWLATAKRPGRAFDTGHPARPGVFRTFPRVSLPDPNRELRRRVPVQDLTREGQGGRGIGFGCVCPRPPEKDSLLPQLRKAYVVAGQRSVSTATVTSPISTCFAGVQKPEAGLGPTKAGGRSRAPRTGGRGVHTGPVVGQHMRADWDAI